MACSCSNEALIEPRLCKVRNKAYSLLPNDFPIPFLVEARMLLRQNDNESSSPNILIESLGESSGALSLDDTLELGTFKPLLWCCARTAQDRLAKSIIVIIVTLGRAARDLV